MRHFVLFGAVFQLFAAVILGVVAQNATTVLPAPNSSDTELLVAASKGKGKPKPNIRLDSKYEASVARLKTVINNIDDHEFVAFAYSMNNAFASKFSFKNVKGYERVKVAASLLSLTATAENAIKSSRKLLSKGDGRRLGAFGVAVGVFETTFALAAPEVAALTAFVFVLLEINKQTKYTDYDNKNGDFSKSGGIMKDNINSYLNGVDYLKDVPVVFTFTKRDEVEPPKRCVVRLLGSVDPKEFMAYRTCFKIQADIHAAEGNQYDFDYDYPVQTYGGRKIGGFHGVTGVFNKRLLQAVKTYCGKVAEHVKVYDFSQVTRHSLSAGTRKTFWGPSFIKNRDFRHGPYPTQSRKFPFRFDPAVDHAGENVLIYTDDSGFALNHPEYNGRLDVINHHKERCNRRPSDIDHGTATISAAIGETTGVAFKAKARVCCADTPTETLDCIYAIAQDMLYFKEKKRAFFASYDLKNWDKDALMLYGEAYHGLELAGASALVAAGQNTANGNNCQSIPAFFPTFITTGGLDIDGEIAHYTAVGECTDLWSPGLAIGLAAVSRAGKPEYVSLFGNSYSSPLAAGAIAVYLSSVPARVDITALYMKLRVMATAHRTVKDLGGSHIKKPVVEVMYYSASNRLDQSDNIHLSSASKFGSRNSLLKLANKFRQAQHLELLN